MTHVVNFQFGELGVQHLDGLLAIYKMERESVGGIVEGHALAAAGDVGQLVDLGGLDLLGQDLRSADELSLRLDDEGGTAEGRLGSFLKADDKGLEAIATVIGAGTMAGSLEEAEVFGKGAGLFDVFVFVEDVCNTHEVDLLDSHIDLYMATRFFRYYAFLGARNKWIDW